MRSSTMLGLIATIAASAWSAAPAQATIYDFTIGPGVIGSFTTDGPSSSDPGYDLITNIVFTLFSGTTERKGGMPGVPFRYTDRVVTSIAPMAAYNPTSGAFINHFAGNTYADSGTLAALPIFDFNGLGSRSYSGVIVPDYNFFTLSASLVVTPESATVPPADESIPEPASAALMAAGLLAGATLRPRRRR